MTTYVLMAGGVPLETTSGLNHALTWEKKGSNFTFRECPHNESEDLDVLKDGQTIKIEALPNEYLATVKPELYNDQGFIGVGRIIIEVDENNILLEKMKYTPELVYQIEREVDLLREEIQSNGVDYGHESWMNGNERV